MMQSIWSRVAQTRGCSCSCKSCLPHALGTTVRNATGRLVRRKHAIAQLSTAAGTDAQYNDTRLVDTKSKLQRRKLLFDEINEAQLPLQLPPIEEIPREARPRPKWDSRTSLKKAPRRQPILLDTIAGICVHEDTLRKWQARYSGRKFLRDEIHHDTGLPRYWGSNFDAHIDLDLVSARIARSEEYNIIDQREPKTPQQLEKLTMSINRLVDDLTYEAVRISHPDNPDAAKRAYESLDGSMIKLKFLRNDGYPVYQHPDLDPAHTYETRRELSRLTRLIIDTWQETTDKAARNELLFNPTIEPFWYQSMVHKICHNLLVSTVPPGIHNYNTMINGFTRIGQHSLAQVVVDHYVRSYTRPTRQTHVCLLHHYRAKEDIVGFYGVLRRMAGLSAHGTKEMRRTKTQVLAHPKLAIWATSTDVAVAGDWVVERTRLDNKVADAIIQGLLSFDRVTDAVKVFLGATEEKIIVSAHVLRRLLEQILDSLDREATQAVLHQGLMRHVDYFAHFFKSRSEAMRLLRGRVYLLFNLAGTQPWAPSTPAMSLHDGDSSNRRLLMAMFTADAASYLAYLVKVIIPSIEKFIVAHQSCAIEPRSDEYYDTFVSSSQDSPDMIGEVEGDPLDARISTVTAHLSDILAALDRCEPPSLDRGRLAYSNAGELYAILQESRKITGAVEWAKEELIHILTDSFDDDTVAMLHSPDVDAMERVQYSIDLWKQREAETLIEEAEAAAILAKKQAVADMIEAGRKPLRHWQKTPEVYRAIKTQKRQGWDQWIPRRDMTGQKPPFLALGKT